MTILRMREEGFQFQATHTIPAFPEGDRDRVLHEHEFDVSLEVIVNVDPDRGYAFDHKVIAEGVEDVIKPLHNAHINDFEGLERGLCEDILMNWLVPRLCAYFKDRRATLTLVELRQVIWNGRDHVKAWHKSDNE